ncbi:carbohydrate ABC transporter permease [Lichenifustis flavocetrariae]|uniref:Carbohydrate ABC transporter permease n=1 Tax=Lichenifustis flavocetrariae TaxID=2949735 RepID=A0AA41YS15_9HYPH|nr:carbohydrate ABC transporter permease [Lichenifustis flavocetrariae]MCW6507476.1 carbohydrate ABC transporter permease [Lichenifustis flavocetrariae]
MKRYLLTAIGIGITGAYLFPLYWMYATALKDDAEIVQYPPTLVPQRPFWNVGEVFFGRHMPSYLWNSLVVAVGVTALVIVLGTGCAYVLGRARGRWVDALLFFVLMMQVLPSSLVVTPLFVGFNLAGLLGTPRLAVILAQTAKALPFYVVICRASFAGVPRDLEEAALVDGHSRLAAFFHIAVPLARNGILVAAVLVFLQSFGEYVFARSMISDDGLQTATVGLSAFLGPNTSDWHGIMTYSAIYVTPILIIFVLLQRRIVAGLTAGAIK